MLLTEPIQAKVIRLDAVIKVKMLDEENFLDVHSGQTYHWTELEPVKIKTEQETMSLIAPEISAKFTATAKIS